jgi:hypothetical protein
MSREPWTRRRFLASLAGTAALAFTGDRESRVLRVGQVLPPHAAAALRGAQLGAEEAGRTAELLGARFELGTGTDGVLAVIGGQVIGGQEAAQRLEVPLLTVLPAEEKGPLRPHVFHVASSPAERRDALERWRKPVPEGARIVDWHPALVRFGAEQLNQRFEARFGSPMDSEAWAAWMAVMAAAEAALRNVPLERLRFDGHKGVRLSFRPEDHGLFQPLYVVAGNEVLGEVAPRSEEGEQ